MVSLLLCALLAQANSLPPATAVVLVSRRNAVSAEKARQVAQAVSDLLSASGVPLGASLGQAQQRLAAAGISDSSDCEGSRQCIARLGALLRIPAVVSIELGQVQDELAIHLEAVGTRDAARLAQTTFVVASRDLKKALVRPIKPFAVELQAALSTLPPLLPDLSPAPLVTGDAPKVRDLSPRSDASVPSSPATAARVTTYAVTGAAVVTAAGAVTFGLLALSARADVLGPEVAGRYQSPYSPAEAQQRWKTVDRHATGALVSALLTAGLGAAAGYLWTQEPRNP